ncbi:hypothetical protein JOC95_003178 [Bacillus tianshenii]|uniref:Uncharacterized protein n=1 Tax=Sutcliffiella tianshenii TaxID=1463404 RepID=A0ABS2P4J3_9BACI|nr:hypothetical protein [Bacillus tianshenii]MBM7621305.1 hypothetical protein [Bacillus tianshenii]MCA1320800.1 hypothetical protein [Bacillus tianshenii]
MINVQIDQVLETLGTYQDTEITYTICTIPDQPLSITYLRNNRCFQIVRDKQGIVEHFSDIEAASSAIKSALSQVV